MTCKICGKEIGYGETYRVMGGVIVCEDKDCRKAYMLQNLTEDETREYLEACDLPEVAAYAKAKGCGALPPWEQDLMLEWYESGDCFEYENDEEPEGYSEYDEADLRYDYHRERAS